MPQRTSSNATWALKHEIRELRLFIIRFNIQSVLKDEHNINWTGIQYLGGVDKHILSHIPLTFTLPS